MKALIIGATGYVGAGVARKFKARGWEAHGLARSDANVTSLESAGLRACRGDVSDLSGLKNLVQPFDLVVLCAPVQREMEPAIASAVIEGLQATDAPRRFIFTSGTGVISTDGREGLWNETTYSEYDEVPFPPGQYRALRVITERLVCESSQGHFIGNVIRPPLIYGHGGSSQIPFVFDSVRKTGAACYLNKGLHMYSNVHIDDLAEVYSLIAERGAPGGLYHAVSGEANFRQIAEAVAQVSGCKTRSLDLQAACELWGEQIAIGALGSNSRSVAPRTRRELGWVPVEVDMIEDIRNGSYRKAYGA